MKSLEINSNLNSEMSSLKRLTLKVGILSSVNPNANVGLFNKDFRYIVGYWENQLLKLNKNLLEVVAADVAR